jgi:S1-C subfamily serine protease
MSVGARVPILLLAGLLGTAVSAHAREGRLGFTVDLAADEAGAGSRIKEVIVTEVAPGSAAARAGMKRGDVLDRFGGTPVAGSAAREFFAAMKVEAGETLVLVVRRDGKPVSLTLVAQ